MSRFANRLVCALSFPIVACSGDPNAAPSIEPADEGGKAVSAAYGALTSGAQMDAPRVIADVDDVVAEDPKNGRATLYSAILRFWQFGEELALPTNPTDLVALANDMVDRFRRAQSLLPDDDRAPAFGGLGKVVIGNLLKDDALRAEGMSDIDHGVEIFPSYSYFLRALASAPSPADSEDFAAVLPAMQAVIDTCGMQRTGAGKYDYPSGPIPSSLRPCNDEGMVPHVWEGFFINYGDLLLKAGKGADEARVAYEAAKNAPRFDHWPFASALQDRIDHAADRAALYADEDTSNDPTLWMLDGHICTGCHQDER